MAVNQEQFVVNAKGEKIGVILSLKHYQQLLEDLHDLAVVAERRQEEPIVIHSKIWPSECTPGTPGAST